MNNNLAGTAKWCENVMVVDADYIDKVAFDLIVNLKDDRAAHPAGRHGALD